jgi:hypothetical protein
MRCHDDHTEAQLGAERRSAHADRYSLLDFGAEDLIGNLLCT